LQGSENNIDKLSFVLGASSLLKHLPGDVTQATVGSFIVPNDR